MSNEIDKAVVTLPRKRGRPKKISNVNSDSFTANNSDSDIKKNNECVSSTADSDDNQIITSMPMPKKRGRKRKSEQVSAVSAGEPSVELPIVETSRSGRTRKKINYWELENEEEINVANGHDRTQTFSKPNLKKVYCNKLLKVDHVEEPTMSEDSFLENGNSTYNDCELDLKDEIVSADFHTSSYSDSKEHIKCVSSTADSDNNQMVTSTPMPKKRGRKKKSEQIGRVELSVESSVELSLVETTRARIKVDYRELENEDEENVANGHDPTYNFPKPLIRKVYVNKSLKVDHTAENTTPEESFLGNGNSSHNDSELNYNDEIISDDSLVVKSVEQNIEIEPKRKYERKGETVRMVKSVFDAAFKNKIQSEAADDPNISNEASSSGIALKTVTKVHNGRWARGRKPKIIIDQNNKVTCVACNEKLDNDEWDMHNRQNHNNLSWREGDGKVALQSKNAVTKILKPILDEDKVIICKKCNISFEDLSNFINHMEICSGITFSTDFVTCAVCHLEMEKNKWQIHKQRQHNNLTWRVGDPPLDLNDQNVVLGILNALYKSKKPLYCGKCDTSKKSVIGFLSHQAQCGSENKEAKVKCQYCDKKVLPVSMQTHVKMLHETPKEKKVVPDATYFDVNTGTPTKRKAAKTAMMVISKFSNDKFIQEHSEHYLEQANFSEEDFVKLLLRKEFSNSQTVKCKFFDCLFESDSVADLVEHLSCCEIKPEQYYTCKKCLFITITDEEMREHLQTLHDVYIPDDDYEAIEYMEDSDIEDEMFERDVMREKEGHYRLKLKRDNTPCKAKPHCVFQRPRRPHQLFYQSRNFTMSFCKQNYSKGGLFNSLRYLKSDWLLLDDNIMERYLPQYVSCDVTRRKEISCESVPSSEYTFKKFELFESDGDEGISTIFCGGPVQAMSWMPTPYTSSNSKQVLAVATLNDFDKKYQVNVHYNEHSLIQFWYFGILTNKRPIPQPKLMFCLAHNFGPVWHLEWCPSGCYEATMEDDTKMSRMGLLAVAGSDSCVYIYSIPHLDEEQMGLIYKVKPLLKLYVARDEESYLNKQKFYATKISWSKVSGHRYVAVGYTDGVVALFDLETSDLLRGTDKYGSEVLLPYKTFQAHTHMITALDWHHLDGGKRWVLTGSFDRNIIVWDLNTGFKIVAKRSVISDGFWLTNWISYLTTLDESSTTHYSIHTVLTSFRNYMYDRVNVTNSASSVKTVSENCWLNAIIHCGAIGDITALFLPQVLYGLDYYKKLKNYTYLFGYTKLIEKNVTFEGRNIKNEEEETTEEHNDFDKYEPITYEEVTNKYGLLFCDIKMDRYSDFSEQENKTPKSNDELEPSKANLYPLQAINKVACNPNKQANLYYATGYQAGFVRVTYMKFLEKDVQIT